MFRFEDINCGLFELEKNVSPITRVIKTNLEQTFNMQKHFSGKLLNKLLNCSNINVYYFKIPLFKEKLSQLYQYKVHEL